MEFISLDDAMKVMAKVDQYGNPIPFAITVVTCDLERNRGGERLVYPQAVLSTPGSTIKVYRTGNNTRNIKAVGSREIRSIHPQLITHLNGKTIAL